MEKSNFETSTYNNMLRYIQESPLSKVFYLEDFAQCGSYTSIRSEIVRMEQNSILVRLARGLYMNSIGYNSMNMNYLIENWDNVNSDYKELYHFDNSETE